MIAFLAPLAFVALAVLGAVVVATYLLKPRRSNRPIASTLLWRSVIDELEARRPWRRIPPSLLLLVQLLALAAGVVALARPYVRSSLAIGPDAIVLLDDSASMQATDVAPNRLAAAQARVSEMIDGLQPDQSMTLIAMGDVPSVLAPRSGDQVALRQALAGVRPTSQTANLAAALSLAASLASDRPNVQVVVVGDGNLDRSQQPAALPFPVRYVLVGGAAENLAIAAFGTRKDAGALVALARVVNYGARTHAATLELRVDGLPQAPQAFVIEPGASANAQWNDLPPAAQQLEVRIDEPDALALDNAAWVVTTGQRPTRVLLVTEGNVFLERALALRPGVSVAHATPGDYAPEGPQAADAQAPGRLGSLAASRPFDLVVFDGFLPPGLPSAGSLLVVDPPPDNGQGLARLGDELPVPQVRAAQPNSPLLANVALDTIHVNRTRQIQLPAWADAIIDTPDTPLLIAGERDGQRVALLGFDLHQSDLPLQPAFPVLVQNLLDWLVPSGSVETPVVRAGEPVRLVPMPGARSIDVVGPDGVRSSVAPPFPPLPFGQTDRPGLYQVVQRDAAGGEVASAFAANFFSPAQSHLVAGGPVAQTRSQTPLGLATTDEPAPREVWAIAAAAMLALLAFEWWAFYHR
jgi:Ca-activated chloride channel homolog